MTYTDSGVVDDVKDKAGFQSLRFRGRTETFSNWLNKNVALKIGDIINYNYSQNGNYRNILGFEYAKSPIAQPQPTIQKTFQPEYQNASAIPKTNSINNLMPVIQDAKKILNECKNAVQDVFGTEEIKPEHIACINTMFIYASKEINYR